MLTHPSGTACILGNMILIKDRHMCNKCIAIIYLGEI